MPAARENGQGRPKSEHARNSKVVGPLAAKHAGRGGVKPALRTTTRETDVRWNLKKSLKMSTWQLGFKINVQGVMQLLVVTEFAIAGQ